MGTNPIYEVQLNKHEEDISDIKGRLHSYDLALKWCEGQIKRLAGDNYSPCVMLTEDKESLEEHNDNQHKEINRLLKVNLALRKERKELKTRLGYVEKEYDKLKNDHNLLKEAYNKLDDRYEREKEIWSGKYNELQTTIDMKNRRITSLEQGAKNQSDVINHKKSEILNLKKDVDDWKEAFLRSQVDVNNFQGAYTDAKKENDRLTECLASYGWRRVSNLEPSPFKDNELYLFIVDGYPTPVIGRYRGGDPSYIVILVDDGNGKGPQHKIVFFMDGCIRYWMPLPEMPDTAIK